MALALTTLLPMYSLAGKSVLVTGGTGSFGKAFIRGLLALEPKIRKVIVFSRDELKQFEMSQKAVFQDSRIRYFIGDVRDLPRLHRAMEDVDCVVHAAALKQVPAAEYNPFECIKTNIIGGQNVIDACLDSKVERVVALSTDKAAGPINLYGATKLCSDKLFVAANNYRGARDLRFSVVRYGNVMGSRGSVIPFFLEQRSKGVLPITDDSMTRFNITLEQGVHFVSMALQTMWGGELFVPKIPSYRILDVAEAIAPSVEKQIVGIRPGEKLHEEMITSSDSHRAAECERHYVVFPSTGDFDAERYIKELGGKVCTPGFSYSSGKNTEWLDVGALRQLILTHVDPAFQPL